MLSSLYTVRVWKRECLSILCELRAEVIVCSQFWSQTYMGANFGTSDQVDLLLFLDAFTVDRQPHACIRYVVVFHILFSFFLIFCYLASSISTFNHNFFFTSYQPSRLNQLLWSSCKQRSRAYSKFYGFHSCNRYRAASFSEIYQLRVRLYARHALLIFISIVGDIPWFFNDDFERLHACCCDLPFTLFSSHLFRPVRSTLLNSSAENRDPITCRTDSTIWTIISYSVISGMLTRYVTVHGRCVILRRHFLAFVHLLP